MKTEAVVGFVIIRISLGNEEITGSWVIVCKTIVIPFVDNGNAAMAVETMLENAALVVVVVTKPFRFGTVETITP